MLIINLYLFSFRFTFKIYSTYNYKCKEKIALNPKVLVEHFQLLTPSLQTKTLQLYKVSSVHVLICNFHCI